MSALELRSVFPDLVSAMTHGTYLYPGTGSRYGLTTKALCRNKEAWECYRSRDVTFMLSSRIFSSEEVVNALMV